jgi:hypothetical protein
MSVFAAMVGMPPPPYDTPQSSAGYAMPVGFAPSASVPAQRKNALLVWGSILRMIGVLLAGIALIWVGVWIMNPAAMVDPVNPFSMFQVLGAIIVLGAVGGILTGIGWSMQTWGVGQILLVDQG